MFPVVIVVIKFPLLRLNKSPTETPVALATNNRVDPIPTLLLINKLSKFPIVAPAPIVTKVDPTLITTAFVIEDPILTELPTDTPEVLFTKILINPTPTVDVILVPKMDTFELY